MKSRPLNPGKRWNVCLDVVNVADLKGHCIILICWYLKFPEQIQLYRGVV